MPTTHPPRVTTAPPEVVPEITPNSAVMVTSRLRAKGRGLFTSEGEHFNNTLFARDSAISARELLTRDPQIAHEAILALAALQGTAENARSDEEPGRIHHELRDFSTWQAPAIAKEGFRAISHVWGGNRKQMLTYFSLDSTALYALLVTDYAAIDPAILDETVVRRGGKEVSIARSLEQAADWMSKHVTKDGLVEVRKRNPFGLIHQTWKDSITGYIREDGEPLNLSKPIAYLEVQAFTAEALQKVSATLPASKKTERYRNKAAAVRQATLDKFWIPDRQFFAPAIDYDDRGKHRRIDVLQSDPGWLLQTNLFDDLPNQERQKYVSGIVRGLFSADFLTDAGLRTRSLQYAGLVKAADYHGSLVTWPIDTYMTAKGLRRQGLPRLASQLESRILNSVNMAGNFYEFFFVDTNGKALLEPEKAKTKHRGDNEWPVQMFPESNIAWTVASILTIKYQNAKRIGQGRPKQGSWQERLENDVLSKIKHVPVIHTIDQLRLGRPEQPRIHIHQSGAEVLKQLSKAYKSMLGRAASWRFRPN